MSITRRTFSANMRVIATDGEMLDELLRMIRHYNRQIELQRLGAIRADSCLLNNIALK